MTPRPRAVLEEFEPRILYSADFAPAALAGVNLPGPSEHRLLQAQEAQSAQTPSAEIAFIDVSLPDAQGLIDDLQAQRDAGRAIDIVRIAADEDGLARISQTLAERDSVTAVHVLSHGSDGVLQLGNLRLDAATLVARAGELAQWSAALAGEADLLLYGCDVAKSANGLALIKGLADLTGADVAASDDLTGQTLLGGDWQLEQRTGAIETALAVSGAEQNVWQGTLALLASDDFSSTGNLNGKGGGTGWAGAWAVSSGSAIHGVSGNLADPSGLLPTSGGSAELKLDSVLGGSVSAVRNLSTSVGADGTTTWISFLLEPDSALLPNRGGIEFGSTSATVGFAGFKGGNFVLERADGSGSVVVSGITPTSGQDYLLVLEIQHAASGDSVTLYVNPTPGDTAPASTFSATKTLELGSFTRIAMTGSNGLLGSNHARLDEIRVGQTFADVTPSVAPVITSLGGGASAATNVAENSSTVATMSASDASLPAQTLTWSISGGADAARFTINASTGVLSFVAAPNHEAPSDVGANNVYDVVVQVSDGALSDTQAIAVTVTPVNDNQPVITSNGAGSSATINVAENTTAVTTVTASDADLPAPTLTYSISGGADAARFTIDAGTGVLSFVAAPDRETPTDTDADNVYDVVVQVSDGSLTDAQAIAVTVTPVNDNNPVITSNGAGASAAINVAENGTGVTTVTANDADLPAQTLTYSISGGADAARFTINAGTGVLSFIAAPNHEAPTDAGANNVYDVVVLVSDGTLSDTQAIAVTVTPVNDNSPVISSNGGGAGAAISVAENTVAVTTVAASDPDLPAPTLSYSISGGADAARFTIDAATGVLSFVAAPNREAPTDTGVDNVYDVIVQASDGTLSDTQALAVTVADANEFGVSAVSDSNVAANSVAENAGVGTLVGATAFAIDADATTNTVTYTLDDTAGGRFAIDAATGVISVSGVLDYESNTSHAVTVRATSADGSFATALFTIGVTDANEAGVGAISDTNAVANQVAENAGVGSAVGITATASDPDLADVIVYSLADSAGGRFAIDAVTGVVTLNGVLDAEGAASHTIVVRADSSDGSFNTQNFTIGVSNVNEFVIGAISDGNPGADAVNENVAVGTLVGITAIGVDADATNSATTYTLDDSAAGRFAIDATTGVVTVAGAIDREAGASQTIVVRATSADGSASTRSFTITVNPLNDNAPLISSDGGGAGASINVAENTSVVTTVVASDADAPAQALTYSITGGADAARFTIDGSTGVLRFVTLPDHEAPTNVGADNVYDVVVQVSDGSLAATQAISVSVDPVNEGAPAITSDGGGANATINVAETTTAVTTVIASDSDQPVQALTYTLAGGADQALFVIDAATGVLGFAAAPVYESPADAGADNVYDVTVRVSDGGLSDTQAIRVTVTPVNDNVPVIVSDGGGAGASISVAENTTAVTTVMATDADLPAQTLSYSISGGVDAARFSIDAGTGALSFASAPDYENPADANADNVYDVIVRASDGSLSATQAISVSVNPVNDSSPGISSNGGGATASIGIAEGSSAVTTVAATDADLPAQALSFAIVGGVDAARFSIDAVTGVLTFAGAPDFELPADAGADNTYDVTVQVSDGLRVDQQAIRVTVSNIDDSAPVLSANRLDISEGGSAAPSIAAADSDSPASALTYSVTGASGGHFELTPAPGVAVTRFDQADLDAGRLRFVSDGGEIAPAYQLSVSDGSFSSAPSAASVNFTPVNDAPVITSDGGAATATLAVAENSRNVTSVTATDAEAASVLRFAITGGADASRFVIDPVSGVLQFAADTNHEQPTDANGDNRYEVTVTVSDGSLSAQQALTVDVSNLNEAPMFVSNVLLLSKDGATLVLLGTDRESAPSALSYQASNLVGGRFERIAAPGVAITNFSQAEVSAGAVRFVTDGSGATPGYALSLSDGVSSVTSAAPDVTYVVSLDPTPATTATPTNALSPAPDVVPTVVAATPAAAPAAPAGAVVAPAPAPADPFGEPAALDYEPTRVSTRLSASASSGAATPSAALRDPSVTGVETLVRFALLSEGSGDSESAGPLTIDLASALRERLLGQELDQLRDAAESRQRESKAAIAASAMLSAGLSVGYVLWLARGGVLVASLMSALPAWAMVDPLPVLARLKRGDGESDDDASDPGEADDPLEKLFSKARAIVARGAAALPPATLSNAQASAPPEDMAAAPAGRAAISEVSA